MFGVNLFWSSNQQMILIINFFQYLENLSNHNQRICMALFYGTHKQSIKNYQFIQEVPLACHKDKHYFMLIIIYKSYTMFKKLFVFSLFLVTVWLACDYTPNTMPLIYAQPQLIERVPNGERYMIGDLEDPHKNYLYVARLKGTAYEMGKAYGQLFKSQLKIQADNFFKYYVALIEKLIQSQNLPPFIVNFIAKDKNILATMKTILDLNVFITKRYTNKRYLEQIQGIADGSGMDKNQISRVNIFPEFVKAACTVAGIWGNASAGNRTLHMRALDWDAANPISKYPMLTIYHPTENGTQKHANIGYVGFVGLLTGMSQKVTIGQKVWITKNSVKMTRYGTPWTYVLRDVLYQATDMGSAIQILTKAHRTCAIHLGVASSVDHNFRIFNYSQKVLGNYDDKNYTYTKSHPKIQGVAYFDKHVQPSSDTCIGQLLSNGTHYANWNMQSFWRVVGGSHHTGDTQLVVFDLEAASFLVSYSSNIGNITENAFARSPMLVEMAPMWENF